MDDSVPTDPAIIARCQELCRLADGSPCNGAGGDCTPANCLATRQAVAEADPR